MDLIETLRYNKNLIIEKTVSWIKLTYPTRTTEFEKCSRDISYVIDAWIIDLENNNTLRTHYISNKFWSRGKSQLKSTDVELLAYDYINTLINEYCPSNEIDNLIAITKHNISTKPEYQNNTFDYITNNRINTYNWTAQIPDQQLIDDLVSGIHDFVPSKQRRVRYNIRIIPAYKMPELQKKIYKGTEAEPSNPMSRYNPQILSPYIIAFGIRSEAINKVPDNYYRYESGVEIGLAAMYLSLAAPAKGLAVGFCACIQNRKDMEADLGIVPQLYLGIGYKSDSKTYHCPVYNKEVFIPNSDYDQKPPMDVYVKYV